MEDAMKVRIYKRLVSGRVCFYLFPRYLFTNCGYTVKWLGLIITHRYSIDRRTK
jgi:hypothetical protein